MGRERKARKRIGNRVQMTAAKKLPRGSRTTSNTVLRAEMGLYPLKTNRAIHEKVEKVI